MGIITDMSLANDPPAEENDWEESTLNVTLEGLLDLETRTAHLKELIDKTAVTRDKFSLEALMTDKEISTISLEGHVGTITRKNVITKELKVVHEALTEELQTGLEDYVSDIREDISDGIKSYDKVLTKLKTTDADIESPDKKTVSVNHTQVYAMFHVKEEFKGEKSLETIRKEDVNIQRMITVFGTAVSRIKRDVMDLGKDGKLERNAKDLPNIERLFLMFNRRISILEGQLDHKDIKVGMPKKFMNWKQNLIIVLGAVLMGPFGRSAARSFQNPKGNSAKVENKLSDIHRFIRYVEGMEDNIDDLCKHVDELVSLFSKVDESNKSALNRRAAPLMELAEFIIKHVTDITRGTDRLFSRLVRKH